MKIEAPVQLKPWFDSLNDVGLARKALAHLQAEVNEQIEVADRRLALSGATRALRRSRDRAARVVGAPTEAVLTIDLVGTQVSTAEIHLGVKAELEAALARDAVRTFRRPARAPHEEEQKCP